MAKLNKTLLKVGSWPSEKILTLLTTGMFPTDDEVGDLLVQMDDNESGMVDYSELLKHMATQVRKEVFTENSYQFFFFRFRLGSQLTLNTTSKRLFLFSIRTGSM